MFERFTDRARRSVSYAQEEAAALKHNYIGTEHILLGLLKEHEGIAAKVLSAFEITADHVRGEIVRDIGPGQTEPAAQIPFTPRAKKVLNLALREALNLGHNYIGTEHILLGLIREGEGVAAQILQRRSVLLQEAREAVIVALAGVTRAPAVGEGSLRERLASFVRKADVSRGVGPACPRCNASLSENAAYKIVEVPHESGEGPAARVLFVYCRHCGTTIDDVIVPEEG